jgi:hypothetical protein
MNKMMKLLVLVLFALTFMMVSSAEANSPVEYTFMWTDLGPGAAGGGTLYADGTAGGHMVVSDNNGQVVAHFHPVSWSEIVPGESVDICFDIHQIKGPPIFPPGFCVSDFGISVPVSGTPVLITNPVDGTDTLLKANPTG